MTLAEFVTYRRSNPALLEFSRFYEWANLQYGDTLFPVNCLRTSWKKRVRLYNKEKREYEQRLNAATRATLPSGVGLYAPSRMSSGRLMINREPVFLRRLAGRSRSR